MHSTPRSAMYTDAVWALGVALLPKCPLCLMAYASMFSGLGVERLPLSRLWPLVVGTLCISLGLTGYRAWRRGRAIRFAVAVLGATALVVGRWADLPRPVSLVGLVVLVLGLVWTRWRLPPRRPVESS